MKKILMAACASCLLATGAQAQQSPFSYNYLQAGIAGGTMKIAGASLDVTGYGVGGSVATGDNAFLVGNFSDGQAKVGALTVNQDSLSLGVGGHVPLGNQTDLLGGLSFLRGTTRVLGYWETSTGYEFDVGLRHALTDKLEVNGGLGISVIGSERVRTTSLSVGLRYKVADKISLGVGYSSATNSGADSSGVNGSLRFEF